MKKRIFGNKKGSESFMMSMLYDMFFSIIILLTLLAFVNSVNSGTYYWRQYYVEDISLTLSLIEGVPEDLSINYVVTHSKALSSGQTGLFVDITPGYVAIFSRNESEYKNIKPFLTKLTSNLVMFSPLEAISIFKSGDQISFSSDSVLRCRTLSRDKTEFVLTKIYLPEDDFLPIKIQNVVKETENQIVAEYSSEIGSYSILLSELFSKNIGDPIVKDDNDLAIIVIFKDADKNAISIKHSTTGNSELANNIACNLFSQLDFMYSELEQYVEQDVNLFIRPASSDEVADYSQENNAVILIEFQSPNIEEFYISNRIFAKVIVDNIKKSTSEIEQEKLTELLTV
jgi:hypothetical protein